MFYSNTLNLIQVGGGTQVKQGDLGSKFSYKLANEKNQELDDFDKEVAHINLVLVDKIVFTTTATVDNSTVTFNIDKAIPVGLYFLEIKIRDYIFPSDKQTIIFVQSGAVAYDLKDLVPNYDTNMTLKDILSDLSQKGIDIRDLNRQLAQKANKDEVTNVMTPKGTLAYASLPTSGNQVGWYYYCPDGDGAHGAGNYVWNGTSWFFGGTGDEGYNLLKEDLDYISQYDTLDVPYTVQNWYIAETGEIASHDYARALIIPCKANTKYIVTKTAGTRYAVGCTSVEPSVGSSCTVFKADDSASNIELQTDENAKYLVAYVWYGRTDIISDTEMIASVRFNMFCTKVSENIITKVNNASEQSLANKHSIENLFYLLSKATFATEPHNTKDYEEKNNPVIDGAWKMKLDADHTGYVQCSKTFSPSGTWEIGIRFLPTARNNTGYYDLITTSVDGTIATGIIIEGSNYDDNGTLSYNAFIKQNGDSSNTKMNLGKFQLNKWIEIHLWYDNGYVYSKAHQDSYTYEKRVSVGQISSGFTVEFGRVKNGIFVGQIDLSETYIKQNGEMWWRAVK